MLRWLEASGVRIVELDGSWSCPVGGAAGVRASLDPTVRPPELAGFDNDVPPWPPPAERRPVRPAGARPVWATRPALDAEPTDDSDQSGRVEQ